MLGLCCASNQFETGSEWLTLGELYPVLRDRLHSKGLPLPNQRGTDTADRFPFTANRALSAPAAAKRSAASAVAAPVSPAAAPEEDTALLRKTALGCFDAIVSYAYGTRDYSDDMTQVRLSELAEYAAVADPDRSERIARRLPDQERRMRALAGIALVMATWARADGHVDAARATDLLEHASRIADELAGLLVSTPLGKVFSQAEPQPSRMGRFMQGLAESGVAHGQERSRTRRTHRPRATVRRGQSRDPGHRGPVLRRPGPDRRASYRG